MHCEIDTFKVFSDTPIISLKILIQSDDNKYMKSNNP